ncbi:uncharacterized protein LOC119792403 [Cyprinodon tularosa]|uniref:uncharacterized protein LOC119792403 n=1 Tax=Cyprinodon tularosa TaxID=77115 RepID=UPI0018E28193|nr:uncharacterized protein LOC119792403 [Cyprinodon tularosa]
MEDFARQTITLTQTDGSQVGRTTDDPISKIPIQFVLKVDSAAPSCIEGLYLPRFVSPTPKNGVKLYSSVNQVLVIPIKGEATHYMSTELLFSGPYNVVKNSLGSGNFSLSWTPSTTEYGESHPICFIIQASNSSSVYQSELRCVIVIVGEESNHDYGYYDALTFYYNSSPNSNYSYTHTYYNNPILINKHNFDSLTYNNPTLHNIYIFTNADYENHTFNHIFSWDNNT